MLYKTGNSIRKNINNVSNMNVFLKQTYLYLQCPYEMDVPSPVCFYQ